MLWIILGIVLFFCFPVIVLFVTFTLGFMILSPFAVIFACKYVVEALIAKWCPQKKKAKQSRRIHVYPENTVSRLR